ncbi:MAG: TrmH family RNA methyltransferase [Pseudomonadota bacterium]
MTGCARSSPMGILGKMPAIIILSKPQLGENIGMVARAMANGGLDQLRLIQPRQTWPNAKAYETSAGANTILDQARVYESANDAIADLHFVYGLSARVRSMQQRQLFVADAVSEGFQKVKKRFNIGFLLGCERSGLDNDELSLVHRVVKIPADPHFSSLNLSQAVMIIAYEWYCRIQSESMLQQKTDKKEKDKINADHLPADMKALDFFVKNLHEHLLNAGFYKSKEMIPVVRRNIQNFFVRTQPMRYEIRTLHGIVRALLKKHQ